VYQRHASTCPNAARPKAEQGECSCVWWVAFRFHGELVREPAGGKDGPSVRDLRTAKNILREKINSIRGNRYRGPEEEKLTVSELLDALEVNLKNRGTKARSDASHIRAAREAFGMDRALSFTAVRIERFQSEELGAVDPRAPATINRIVEVVRRAFNLARKQERISRVPYFPMLSEADNVRQGFTEPAVFEAIAKALPEDLADAARFAYLTGWRKGQVAKLGWEHVDRANRLLSVPGTITKSGKPHTLALEGELWELIERRTSRRQVARKDGTTFVAPFVFHRGDGRPVGDIRKTWSKACAAAGKPGLLFHDLRRSGVRNLIRAGVDQHVAMKISGHKTASMLRRYDVIDERDQREAFRLLETYVTDRKEQKA
jgi:integrase